MTDSPDLNNQAAGASEPADLAEAAIGLPPELLARDEEGKVAAGNGHAEARFGWAPLEVVGEDFFEYVAVEGRDGILPILAGEYGDPAGLTLPLRTRRRDGSETGTEVAIVPIRVGDGYPLNKVLQDIVTPRGNPIEITRMKKRHAEVLRLIVTAVDGGEMPDPLDDDGWQPEGHRVEERWQAAGALVIFDGREVSFEEPVAAPGDRPHAAAPAHREDALELLRDENHELRSRLRAAERE